MITPQQQDLLYGLVAGRATRMAFSGNHSEAVVEAVINDDLRIISELDDVDEVLIETQLIEEL